MSMVMYCHRLWTRREELLGYHNNNSMVMYRSNSDHNVVCRDIWFRIERNLGPF